MGSWSTMGADNLNAAKRLHAERCVRSAISRSYYSAYALTTDALIGTGHTVSAAARSNPSHAQIATLVKHNLAPDRLADHERQDLSRRIRTLQRLRVAADYDPETSLTEQDSLIALQHASVLAQRVGGVL